MNVIETELSGVKIVEPKVFGDERGFFMESWNRERYLEHGLPGDFVQDNLSFSRKGVLRGLHFQQPNAQGKLVYVLQGAVFDVAVDIRRGSPTFGQWVGVELSSENRRQLWVPPGMAHGFCVTSETALFAYKVTDRYNPEAELSLAWDDPEVGVQWPLEGAPELSAKDREGLALRDLPEDRLLSYAG